MSVQNGWKEYYKMFVVACHNNQIDYAAELRDDMWNCRREAALERRIERMDRENKDLEDRLNEANEQAWHDRM